MRQTAVLAAGLFMIGIAAAPTASALFDKGTEEEQRQDIEMQSQMILWDLYNKEPQAKRNIQNAYGYATFSNFGMKIFLAGGGKGKGVAVNNQTGEKTYMKMAEIQAGLGLGVKTFKLVWVFQTADAYDQFVNSGWEFGAQASAAAKYEDTGGSLQGAIAIAPGVWLYQLTESGLALELTAKGTKYYKNDDLNEK